MVRQQTTEPKANTHSENQQFLKDIVGNVLDGQGIGWLKINRVKKLMEDENYRNFVLSRLNINLDKKYSDEDDHIEDIVRLETILQKERENNSFLENQSSSIQRNDQYSSCSHSRFRSDLRKQWSRWYGIDCSIIRNCPDTLLDQGYQK